MIIEDRRADTGPSRHTYPHTHGRLLGTRVQTESDKPISARCARARGVSSGRRRRRAPTSCLIPSVLPPPGLSPSHGMHGQRRSSIPTPIYQYVLIGREGALPPASWRGALVRLPGGPADSSWDVPQGDAEERPGPAGRHCRRKGGAFLLCTPLRERWCWGPRSPGEPPSVRLLHAAE